MRIKSVNYSPCKVRKAAEYLGLCRFSKNIRMRINQAEQINSAFFYADRRECMYGKGPLFE